METEVDQEECEWEDEQYAIEYDPDVAWCSHCDGLGHTAARCPAPVW